MDPNSNQSTKNSEGADKISDIKMAGIAKQALAVLNGPPADNGEDLEEALRRSSRMELNLPAGEAQSQRSGVVTAGETETAGSSPVAQEVETVLRSIYTQSTDSIPEESAREMRFAIRLIVIRWVDLINQGATARSSFCKEALHAVDPAHAPLPTIRIMAARSVGSILKTAEWDMNSKADDGQFLGDDQQPANKTIHQAIEGMKRVNAEINAVLEQHGSVELEFDDSELEEEEEEEEEDDEEIENENEGGDQDSTTANPRPRPRMTVPSDVTPMLTPQHESSNALVGKKLKWTAEEDDVLVQVWRDMPNAKKGAITAEHNRRMKGSRDAAGSTIHYNRTTMALRHHLHELLKARGLA